MDPLWIVAAFAFGAVSTRIGLPPLVGYLVAGMTGQLHEVLFTDRLNRYPLAARQLSNRCDTGILTAFAHPQGMDPAPAGTPGP